MRLTYAYGKDGVILGVGSIHELCTAHGLPPLAEVQLDTLSDGYPRIPEGGGTSLLDIRVRIGEGYRTHQKFGPWGDLIAVSTNGPFLYFNFIAPLAFRKPTLAADLIPFIRDAEGRLFWIGIKRGRPPGEGKHALIGGIRAIEKRELRVGPTYMLETPLENLMHESEEEAGIILGCNQIEGIGHYSNTVMEVSIPELDIIPSQMDTRVEVHNVGTLRTDIAAERDPSTGELRVHETTGYMFLLHVVNPLSVNQIEAALHPTDTSEHTIPIVRQVDTLADMKAVMDSFHAGHHRKLFALSFAKCMDNICHGYSR